MRMYGAGGKTALVCVFCSVSGLLAACSAGSDGKSGVMGSGATTGSGGSSAGTEAVGGIGAVGAGGSNIDIGGMVGTDPPSMATMLAFDPPTVTLVIDGTGAVKTASYSLSATFSDKTTSKVTAESLQFDRPDLASAKNGSPVVLTATGAVAGKGTLHAIYGQLEATAELDVQLVEKHVEGTIPDDVLKALDDGGAQDPKLTALLYPYDKTVLALGLQSPLFMWTAVDAVTDVYRLHVEQAGYKYDLYSFADAPGRLAIPQDTWDRVTSSNAGDPMVVTLYRYDAAAKAAYSSATVNLTIAHESLRGALYYWTASRANAGIGNITRIYPGVGAKPESLGTGKCMGCHSVSADGSTMVVDIEGVPTAAPYQAGFANTRAWASFKLPEATLGMQTSMYGAGPALTPDGKYVVFGNGMANPPQAGSKNFSLAETATGKVVATSGLDDIVFSAAGLNLMMPQFSLDGKKLVAVEGGNNITENVIPDSCPADKPCPPKRIVYMDFDPAAPKFDPKLHEVVNMSQFPAGNQGLGYPAFTPDNNFIAYHTGKYSTGCHPKEADEVVGACLDGSRDSGEIWVSPVGGGTPIRLAALNDPPATKDHNAGREPMFCPVKRGGYSWMVFTSMRDWGNKLVDAGPNTNAKRRLWVAAIDGDIKTADPSHPAFYLEGQEDTPNMRAFWALSQCIQTPPPGEKGTMCKNNFECCSGFCVEGQCVDKTTESCVGIGGECAMRAQCCNSSVVSCEDMHCKVEPPK